VDALDRDVAGAFESAGLAPEEMNGRLTLFRETAAEFDRVAARRPALVWWSPGRIEVFGKHTDYAGGRSLVAAVPRGFAMLGAPRADRIVRVRDARWAVSEAIDLSEPAREFTGWANYVAVVARRLQSDFPGAALGCDITFASDVPRAAGVSSSSALVVGIASLLIEAGRLRERPEWRTNIGSPLDLAGYLGAMENGLAFGGFAAAGGVGTHGGSEDHTAIINCEGDRLSAFSYVPVREAGSVAMPEDWRFLVMTSGVEASKAGAVKARYNALSLMTRRLAELWNRAIGGDATATLGRIVRDEADGVSRLGRLIDAQAAGPEADALRDRLRHFAAEDARVPAALAAFGRADADTIGALAAASQDDAERLLRNQIPETSALAAAARQAGAFAATSFGAGFGGSAWALAARADAHAVLAEWREAFCRHHAAGPSVGGFVARPAPGAIRIR
jgi:galactokinase